MSLHKGFTLIEFILVIVIMGIALLGLMPVFNHVIASAHRVSELHQAQLLAQEWMSQGVATRWGTAGFEGLNTVLFVEDPDAAVGPVLFERCVEIQSGSYNSGSNSLACSGAAYINEDYKCLIVTVRLAEEGSTLARRWTMFAK